MRVIAGKYRSRILKSLKGLALRPTSDRLRETLFNVLGDRVSGSRFVDAFAGTGAVGIEALSRGAVDVLFIENHAPAAARGLDKLAAEHKPTDEPVGFVFLDPPYANAEQYARVLGFLGSARFLAPGSLVIAEHRRTLELPQHFGKLLQTRVLRQGDAALSFFEWQATEGEEIPFAA